MPENTDNVVERVREQLQLAGKIRGFKRPKYQVVGNKGQKELVGYDRQHMKMQGADIIELCELATGNGHGNDEIVKVQLRAAQLYTTGKGFDGTAVLLADDVFRLVDLASSRILRP